VDAIQTTILQENWEVEPRLQELGLTKEGLLHVRDVSVSESAKATAFHAANAAGTSAYHEGTWALRDQFVGGDWSIDRSDGVETIKNDKLKVRVAFSNVDIACNSFHIPKDGGAPGTSRRHHHIGGFWAQTNRNCAMLGSARCPA
jgi:hypothetical protein